MSGPFFILEEQLIQAESRYEVIAYRGKSFDRFLQGTVGIQNTTAGQAGIGSGFHEIQHGFHSSGL